MHALSAADLVQIWELGLERSPVDRAILILKIAMPEKSDSDLLDLSIGARDALLLSVRQASFGSRIKSTVQCPQCKEYLDLLLSIPDLRLPEVNAKKNAVLEFKEKDYQIKLRIPNCRDLRHFSAAASVNNIYSNLLENCILAISRKNKPVNRRKLPNYISDAIAKKMSQHDPQAEIYLSLDCAVCSHKWKIIFDIASYLWIEIETWAKRLIQQVHILATAYGWRECDILAMSAVRRQYYIQLVA